MSFDFTRFHQIFIRSPMIWIGFHSSLRRFPMILMAPQVVVTGFHEILMGCHVILNARRASANRPETTNCSLGTKKPSKHYPRIIRGLSADSGGQRHRHRSRHCHCCCRCCQNIKNRFPDSSNLTGKTIRFLKVFVFCIRFYIVFSDWILFFTWFYVNFVRFYTIATWLYIDCTWFYMALYDFTLFSYDVI